MKIPNISVLLVSLYLISMPGFSQAKSTTYLPNGHRAYDFLEQMEHRFADKRFFIGTKPATRCKIAQCLFDLVIRRPEMTDTEKEEFDALIAEFGSDFSQRGGLVWEDGGPVERLPKFVRSYLYRNHRNFYSRDGDTYRIYFDPVIVRSARIANAQGSGGGDNVYVSTNGFKLRGVVGERVGFHIDIRDSREWGDRSYPTATSTTLPGIGWAGFKGDHAEYDETYAHVTYSGGPFTLGYGRDRNVWGRGSRGTLLLSGYGAPYDMARIDTEFGAFRFTFFTGELKQYPPVAQFYYTSANGSPADSVTVKKHISGHRLELRVNDRLSVGLHEAVIYAGRWELSYLNPVMFLKGGEHFNGDHDNAAMGADFRYFIHRSHSVYGELLIDDITTTKLGSSWYGNKLAWQIGTFLLFPFGISDSDVRIEYTRIQPWVYTHRFAINSYSHYGDVIGYELGPNSDEVYFLARKRFSRRLHGSAGFTYSRHGGNTITTNEDGNTTTTNVGGDALDGWSPGDSKSASFLAGDIDRRKAATVSLSWEPAWECFVKGAYTREIINGLGFNVFTVSFGLQQ